MSTPRGSVPSPAPLPATPSTPSTIAIAPGQPVVFDLAFPGQSMTGLWNPLLPWVDNISLGNYVLGVAETLLYGWFVALIFGPLFNLFAERSS